MTSVRDATTSGTPIASRTAFRRRCSTGATSSRRQPSSRPAPTLPPVTMYCTTMAGPGSGDQPHHARTASVIIHGVTNATISSAPDAA